MTSAAFGFDTMRDSWSQMAEKQQEVESQLIDKAFQAYKQTPHLSQAEMNEKIKAWLKESWQILETDLQAQFNADQKLKDWLAIFLKGAQCQFDSPLAPLRSRLKAILEGKILDQEENELSDSD